MKTFYTLFIIVPLVITIVDLFVFLQIRRRFHSVWSKNIYWTQTILALIGVLILYILAKFGHTHEQYYTFSTILGIINLIYVPKILYLAILFIAYIFRIFSKKGYRIVKNIGITLSIILFLFLGYTITWGRYNYGIQKITLSFSNLPTAFDNFRIIQLSDLHLGSNSLKTKGIQKLVDLVNKQNPDLIVFTGDMINSYANELKPWIETLSKLKAKYGIYAVKGNHDYGLYVQWANQESNEANLHHFEQYMQEAGFKLLDNDHVDIVVNKDTLYLAGIENWNIVPFSQDKYIEEALSERRDKFTILLAHYPPIWKKKLIPLKIPLTLSGHTHAMQAGIKIGGFKWSPAKYIYSEYEGIYQEEDYYMNVNRGQGFIGYPGRIGMFPKVDLIILKQK